MAYQGVSPATSGSLANLYDESFDKIYFDNFTRASPEWSKLAKVESINEYSVKEGKGSTFGAHRTWTEGSSITYDTIAQGPSKEITFSDYALGFQVTRKMSREDKTGTLKQIPAELSKSSVYTLETLFWDLLNSGFVTTYHTGIDSYALFSASHPRMDGGTWSNLGTGALSETTLEAAVLSFRKLVNDKNIPIPGAYVPKILVIPPELEKKAQRLLLSELRPGTMDNDINVLKLDKLSYMVCSFLTSTTAWFLLSQNHDLRHLWRVNVAFESADDFHTKNGLFSSTFACADEFVEARGCYGSSGA